MHHWKPRLSALAISVLSAGVLAAGAFGLGLLGLPPVMAQSGPAPSAATAPTPMVLPPPADWQALGLMVGAPPPPDKRVTRANANDWPFVSWTLQHTREIYPTRTIARGGPVAPLPRAVRALNFAIPTADGQSLAFADFPRAAYLDALVILKNGRLVHESYTNGMQPDTAHLMFSMTKSFTGLCAELLIDEGKLDPSKRIDSYLPELKDSAWGEASVRDVLDMRDGVRFNEDYLDPRSDIFAYAAAWGWGDLPPPLKTPDGFAEALKQHTARYDRPGGAFRYRSAATDVIGWIVARVEGKPLAQVISTRIWSKLGVEHDAFMLVDRAGQDIAAAGMNATARDLARFGEMLRNRGRANGQQIVPARVIAAITAGGDRAAFAASNPIPARANWTYRSQFWIMHDADRAFTLLGVRGQRVYVNPTAGLVVVTLGTHPMPGTGFTEALHQSLYAGLKTALR